MKRILFIAGLLFFGVVSAQGEEKGIHFFHGTMEELKAEAKAKNKLIFLDAYTSWCGPCKMMSAQTFTDEKIGEFFNKNFINYKLDMEQGEGPGIAIRYKVQAYPTLLFIDSKGNEVHRVLGFRKPDQLMLDAQKATDPTGNVALLKSAVENGSQDPDQLYNYATKLAEGGNDYQEVARRYFDTQAEKDLTTDKNWKAIQQLTDSIESREFQYLLKKKADFVKKYKQKEVEEVIYKVCARIATAAIKKGDDATFNKAEAIVRKNIADNGRLADRMKLEKAESQKNWNEYATQMVAYLAKFKETDAMVLNQIAWNFYEQISDKSQLEKALTWAKQSVALNNQYFNNDTVAALLFKLERYEEARKWANTALYLARQTGENAESTEALLTKIEEKL